MFSSLAWTALEPQLVLQDSGEICFQKKFGYSAIFSDSLCTGVVQIKKNLNFVGMCVDKLNNNDPIMKAIE